MHANDIWKPGTEKADHGGVCDRLQVTKIAVIVTKPHYFKKWKVQISLIEF